ncbi:hypothetical protein TrVFT333_002102 [Trichoderma virens FT-333]|nr:hypothetical protein TrVFT333_002102 [Trichoderma virens FT-333]
MIDSNTVYGYATANGWLFERSAKRRIPNLQFLKGSPSRTLDRKRKPSQRYIQPQTICLP